MIDYFFFSSKTKLFFFPQKMRVQIKRLSENAVMPVKKNESDVGCDVTIVKFIRQLDTDTYYYDTELMVKAPFGYYVEIILDDKFKTTYNCVLAYPVCITNGQIRLALTKLSESNCSLDVPLPCVCGQLILRSTSS